MIWGLCILGILSLAVPAAVGLVGLYLALHIFLNATGISLPAAEWIGLTVLLFSVPMAALLAGRLLDDFAGERLRTRSFEVFLPVLACCLMFGSGAWLEYFEAAFDIVRKAGPGKQALLFVSTVSGVVLCGGLAAFVMMALQLCFELPVRWLQGAVRPRIDLAFAAARPLLIVVGLTVAFNLLTGLFAHELWPATLLAQLGKL